MKYFKNHIKNAGNISAVVIVTFLLTAFFSGLIYGSWKLTEVNTKAFNIIFLTIVIAFALYMIISSMIKSIKSGRIKPYLINLGNTLTAFFLFILALFLLPGENTILGIVFIVLSVSIFTTGKILIKKFVK